MSNETNPITLTDILDALRAGDLDNDLDLLSDAIRTRRKGVGSVVAANALVDIAVGSTVRLKGLSPKYVNGLTAKVTGKGRSRFEVVLDNPPAGGRFHGTVRVPANCVEVVG